jgi:hypothetical protein
MKRDGVLLAAALLIGLQIPATIEKIGNPTVKALVQIIAVLALVYCAMKVDLSKFGSIRPPPPKEPGQDFNAEWLPRRYREGARNGTTDPAPPPPSEPGDHPRKR